MWRVLIKVWSQYLIYATQIYIHHTRMCAWFSQCSLNVLCLWGYSFDETWTMRYKSCTLFQTTFSPTRKQSDWSSCCQDGDKQENLPFFIENEPLAAILNFWFWPNSYHVSTHQYQTLCQISKESQTYATSRARTNTVYGRGHCVIVLGVLPPLVM